MKTFPLGDGRREARGLLVPVSRGQMWQQKQREQDQIVRSSHGELGAELWASCGAQSLRENGLPKLRISFSSEKEPLLGEREGGGHPERRFREKTSHDL